MITLKGLLKKRFAINIIFPYTEMDNERNMAY